MALIGRFFKHTFSTTRVSRVSDGQGGWTEVDGAQLSGVRCRVRPATARERELAWREEATVDHVLYCSAPRDLVRDDLVTTSTGLTARVTAVREPSHLGRHLEVDLEEIQRGR